VQKHSDKKFYQRKIFWAGIGLILAGIGSTQIPIENIQLILNVNSPNSPVTIIQDNENNLKDQDNSSKIPSEEENQSSLTTSEPTPPETTDELVPPETTEEPTSGEDPEDDENKFATKILYENELPNDSEGAKIIIKIQEGWKLINKFENLSCGQKVGFYQEVPTGISKSDVSEVTTVIGGMIGTDKSGGRIGISTFDEIGSIISETTKQTLNWEKEGKTFPQMTQPDAISDWSVYQKYQNIIFMITQPSLEDIEHTRVVNVHDLFPVFDQYSTPNSNCVKNN